VAYLDVQDATPVGPTVLARVDRWLSMLSFLYPELVFVHHDLHSESVAVDTDQPAPWG
jgi:hypothetical protein